MLYKSFLLLAFLLLVFSLGLTSVSAEVATPSSKRMVKTQAACDKATERINQFLSESSPSLTKRQSYAANRKANIQKRIDNLAAKGADVSKLKTDFQQYIILLDKWVTDYNILITNFKLAQNFKCQESKTQFKDAVKTAQDQRKILREDREAIRKFYVNTLKPDFQAAIQALKNSKKQTKDLMEKDKNL